MTMKIVRLCLLLFSISIGLRGVCQTLPDVERLLESNDIENTEDGYEDMVNTLLYLAQHPLDINTAGFDSLKMLFFLSDSQIDRLLSFRQKHGGFRDVSELLLVPGIGERDWENILPFITIECGEAGMGKIVRTRHELLARVRTHLPASEGYKLYAPHEFEQEKDYYTKVRNRFHGPPWGSLVKYKYRQVGRVQAGITLENDPGEGYFTRHQRAGFDFVSAHVQVEGKGCLRQVVAGDYKVQWGQGLVAWGGFTSGKSDVTVGNEKSGKGFAANTSTDENRYLRGAAVSLSLLKNMAFDVFVSYKKTDATLVPKDTLEEDDFVSVSLYESGYHRNDNECAKKRLLKEFTSGMAWRWNTPRIKVGAHALYYDFTPDLIPGERPYQQFQDDGHRRWMAGVDYKTAFRGIYLFGETAVCDRGSISTVNGLRVSNSFLSANVLYRRYDKRYVSHYAAGFGEYGNTSNEEGVYCGADVDVCKGLKLSVYYDWFRFFSARYLASRPDWGWELLGTLTYTRSVWEHALRYKREVKPEDLKGGAPGLRYKQEVRYQLNCRPHSRLELRTRLTASSYRKGDVEEKGLMAAQDFVYSDEQGKFKMQCRVAWFDTDSYQSRIYAYENNVLYGYSFPSFMGEGWRTYLNLSWKPVKGLTCYLKSGFIIYPGQESIGSGLTKVEDNKRYDLALQVRLTF